ncbi:hypothetical protein GCM10022214_01090 [Actinomadura miaoliensis]|uniref:Uncharacterized protein n=1 Tax=Actinomadura miaoliensis TaxID=430685 RepID=A0ABP7UVY0_9ACTN
MGEPLTGAALRGATTPQWTKDDLVAVHAAWLAALATTGGLVLLRLRLARRDDTAKRQAGRLQGTPASRTITAPRTTVERPRPDARSPHRTGAPEKRRQPIPAPPSAATASGT